jgi:hypothetical protein
MKLIGSVPGKRFHVVFAISSNIHRNIPHYSSRFSFPWGNEVLKRGMLPYIFNILYMVESIVDYLCSSYNLKKTVTISK